MKLPLSLRLALRDLRSGFGGLRILLACIVLGVTAIAAVGSLSEAVRSGLEEEGQPLLGGDVEITVAQRRLNPAERQFIARWGEVSAIVSSRAMASAGEHFALIEIKATDSNYPLYGSVGLSGAPNLDAALALRGSRHGIAVDPLLMDRLGLSLGDGLKIGETAFELRASITSEPDRIADGFVLGPRVLMTQEALALTGLVKPGSLLSWRYRLKLRDPSAYRTVADAITREFPDAGWRIRTRNEAAPGVSRYLERLTFFLTLVGITSLIVGGVGIANAVAAFIGRRRRQIAMLRLIGSDAALVFSTYLWEVMLAASAAILAGLIIGALLPFAIRELFGSLFPVPLRTGIYAAPLALAALFGFLTTLVFSLWPLARAREIGPLELIRNAPILHQRLPALRDLLTLALSAACLLGLFFLAFGEYWMTLFYILGLAGSLLLLLLLGRALTVLARHAPKPANAGLRFAIGNLYRPGTPLPSIVLSLGLGLTLFVTLALLDRSLRSELQTALPAHAPSYFFLDVASTEQEGFLAAVREEKTVEAVITAPMLRGRITKVKGTPAAEVKAAPEGAWALRGDRGLTFAENLPEGSRLVSGGWWPKDYAGPPLVSFTEDVAKAIGLSVGDQVSVNVLGRELNATVASLRLVDWRSLGMNFVMVFSPNALAGAPHSNLVTVSLPPEREAALMGRIARSFPTVTAVRVKDALDAVSDLLGKLVLAVRAASGVAIATGLLVLSGALATSLSARTYDAIVLKTFGATRPQLIAIYAVEFLVSGLATSLFAIVAGSLAAWALTRYVLEIPLDFSPAAAFLTAGLSMTITLLAGLIGSWRALGARPAVHLRRE
ncbi:MAG TPA: FtsX-like permease family protein [Aestuariivirgaceae bacterium]|nr:FtsX-like permease family protein [Aestuariivirgaceae bacterium]